MKNRRGGRRRGETERADLGQKERGARTKRYGGGVRQKSRKELRKEERRMKKERKRSYYMGKKSEEEEKEKKQEVVVVKKKKKEEEVVVNEEKEQQEQLRARRDKRVCFAEAPRVARTGSERARRERALRDANSAEEREIRRLEKRLGLHKRKNKKSLPQCFISDGLDYILNILEPGAMQEEEAEGGVERDNELEQGGSEDGEEDQQMSEEEFKDDEEEEFKDDEEEEEKEEFKDDEEEEFKDDEEEEEIKDDEAETSEEETVKDDDDDDDEERGATKQSGGDGGKYVPPHQRSSGAELERVKRSLKGLMNRLSESNMASIGTQVEEMYMSYSRKDMNDALTEVVLTACVTNTLMPDRLLMEHVLLISVLHHTVGLEVGAHFLEAVVRRFDEAHSGCDAEGKECDNLLSVIAHLYNFHVVEALLLFELLRRLLASFTARDVELLLLLLRNVGFSLRKDDPLALKELIGEAQRRATAEGPRFHDQTRVRFMLENMMALKNNDMRKIPGYDPEPVERLRKLQRTLVQHRCSGTDVKLRVSLQNLLEAERVGRWWIVGSSWTGAPMITETSNSTQQQRAGADLQFSTKVLDLARAQRMNTEVRRNIFCVLMTSEDYLDAFDKLIRLGLKGQQERDIIYVLVDCCLQEKSFNAFYSVLAHKFCSHDRRFQMTLQFCLWDKFKELSSLSSSSFSNLVQLVMQLLHRSALSLSILKTIEFGEMDKLKVKFLKQILTKLLLQTQPEQLVQIFSRISGIAKLAVLREGLKLFIQHFLLRSVQVQESGEQQQLRERAQVACRAVEAHDAKLKL